MHDIYCDILGCY